MTHDYKRHGTTTLFAALDVISGFVVGECLPRHRAKEFLRFLRKIDRATKKSLDLHIVLDNYGTHKTPEVKAWLLWKKKSTIILITTTPTRNRSCGPKTQQRSLPKSAALKTNLTRSNWG